VDGLLKAAPQDLTQNNTGLAYSTSDGLQVSSPAGAIPVDVLTYFDVPLSSQNDKEMAKLKEIHKWARDTAGPDATIGDLMQRIASLDRELGYATDMNRRYDKVFNYCVLSSRIKDLDNRRDALRRRF
jgi:hypothetical protein